MNAKKFMWQFVHICMVALVAVFIGCSEDDPVNPDPTPGVDPDNGEVTFVITNENGSGTGTVDAPAEVSNGDTLSMVISQKSSYTDSDGTVFTCEPEAKFSTHAVLDTVYAQNEDLLTKIEEDSDVVTSKEGENPVRNLIKQTINVGPQTIKADLDYEVYTYINKAQQAIEMPYAKLNEISLGSPSADEEGADAQQTRAEADITKAVVTLTPLAQTRAVLSDTTLYNVNVLLYEDVEIENAKDQTTQQIVISVNYIGAVVTSMEIPDEDNGTVSFEISAEGGDGQGTSASPYVVSAGNTFNLQISQRSSYTDLDWSVYECEPQASVSLYAEQDIVYAESLEQLTSLAGDADVTSSQDGTNPVSHTLTQVFNVGGQSIHFDLGYEVYTYTNQANTEVEMPYIRVNEAGYQGTQTQNQTAVRAAVRGATVSATPSTRATVSDTTLYDVTVRFNLELESVNAAETSNQTIAFAVTYPGAVITETEVDEPDLVSVKYRTGYVWEEAHDNLPLLYYATVYRDRHYSNGDVITDTFVDAGHMASFSLTRRPENAGTYTDSGITAIYSDQKVVEGDYEHSIKESTVQVPDPLLIREGAVSERHDTQPGDWNAYSISKLYDESSFISAAEIPSNEAWENDDRATGWYFSNCGFSRMVAVDYQGETLIEGITRYSFIIDVYDQFLVIDGRRIDFLQYRPDFHFDLSIENISNGVLVTCELRFTFMERDFYTVIYDTYTAL